MLSYLLCSNCDLVGISDVHNVNKSSLYPKIAKFPYNDLICICVNVPANQRNVFLQGGKVKKNLTANAIGSSGDLSRRYEQLHCGA